MTVCMVLANPKHLAWLLRHLKFPKHNHNTLLGQCCTCQSLWRAHDLKCVCGYCCTCKRSRKLHSPHFAVSNVHLQEFVTCPRRIMCVWLLPHLQKIEKTAFTTLCCVFIYIFLHLQELLTCPRRFLMYFSFCTRRRVSEALASSPGSQTLLASGGSRRMVRRL
jgi:hypothetical protein